MQNGAKQSQKGSLEIKIKESQGEKIYETFLVWGGRYGICGLFSSQILGFQANLENVRRPLNPDLPVDLTSACA
jgi:hypothetical protein